MAHIGDNPVAVDLSTVQYRIPTTVDGDGLPLSVVVSVHSVPLPFSLPFAALTLAKTLIPAPILTPTPPPLLLFLPVVFCVFAAPL
nr:hypothetical protein [Escherichia coli]